MTDSRSDPTIVQRLMQALEADTAVELARALGLPVADVEQALAKGQVPDEWVRICAAETGCNADWLFFGRGPMRLPLVESGAMPACLMLEDVDDDVDMITVPLVVARLSAGSGSLEVSSEQEGGYAFRSDFLHRKGNPRRMVLMRVSGDSMVPEIFDNDLVLLDQGQTEISPGRLYAVGFEDAIYIKRIDIAMREGKAGNMEQANVIMKHCIVLKSSCESIMSRLQNVLPTYKALFNQSTLPFQLAQKTVSQSPDLVAPDNVSKPLGSVDLAIDALGGRGEEKH